MADTDAVSKAVISALNEVKNAARTMAQASEKLSNTGLEKFTAEVKKSLKNQGLLNEEDLKTIKNTEDLQKVLGGLEDKFSAIAQIEKEAAELKKRDIKAAKGNAGKIAKAEKAAKDLLEARLEEIGLTEDMSDAIKKGLPGLREETASRWKLIAAGDGLVKSYEEQKKSVLDSVKSFGTWKKAQEELGKAYNIMQRATSKGMLGTLGAMSVMSYKLAISASDLEDIMAKNHAAINQMGGGIKGMETFGAELGDIRQDLKFLGEGATKAAALMYEYSKKAGLQKKDGDAYDKNMKEASKQMIAFMGNFGDTAESYNALMDGLNEEANNRGILNNLSKDEILLNQREQRTRVENLKFMGLNNQEILEMNQRLSDLNNNASGQIATRATEALNFKSAIQADIDLMMKSSDIADQQRGKELKENQDTLNKMADLYQNKQMDALKQLQESDKGRNALATLSKTEQAKLRDGTNQFDAELSKRLIEASGKLGDTSLKNGSSFSNAEGRGDYFKPEDRKKISDKNQEITAATGTAATTIDLMTQAVKKTEAVFNNVFIAGVAGAAAAAIALAAAAAKAAWALNMIKAGGGKGIPGIGDVGDIGKAGGKLAMLGKVLKVGTLALGAYETWNATSENDADAKSGKISENEANKKNGSAVGGFGGAAAGAEIGAGFGAAFGGVGAIPGALIGGALGYFGGSALGGAAGGMFGDKDVKPSAPTAPKPPSAPPPPGNGSSSSKVHDFIAKYGAAAEVAAGKLGIDPKVLLGQWGLETGWGKSVIPGTNNLGNIKDFSGKGVSAKDNMTGSTDKYKSYDSPEAFGNDYASLIARKYPGAVGASSPEAYAAALKAGGYAEDPNYVNKVSTAARMAGAGGGSSLPTSTAPSMPVLPQQSATAAPLPSTNAGAGRGSQGTTAQAVDPATTELIKQTAILAQIAQNTGTPAKTPPSQKGYLKDPAVVMSGVHG